jgi:hypothetical protein
MRLLFRHRHDLPRAAHASCFHDKYIHLAVQLEHDGKREREAAYNDPDA